MVARVETRRVHRTWTERFLLWKRAYETKAWGSGREVIGRGSTPEQSEEAALRRWNEEIARDHQGSDSSIEEGLQHR
jgi:hypothetical protein